MSTREPRLTITGFIMWEVSACLIAGCSMLPAAEPQLGDMRARDSDGAMMVYVPAGEFRMGSTIEDSRWARNLCRQYTDLAPAVCTASELANERPPHIVALDAYWIDRTEVTNGRYAQCVLASVCSPPVNTGSFTRETYYADRRFDDYPVVWVRWDQAQAYCRWAGGRLPSEAEWEYAARGPEALQFPWGNEFDSRLLNYCDAGCPGLNDPAGDDGFPDTAPVGSFPDGASWCGALDMAGNVREWVADWFGYYSPERQVNPTGPASGDSHIPRGGSWYDRPDDVRSTNRGSNSSDYTRHKVGFRCALSAGQ